MLCCMGILDRYFAAFSCRGSFFEINDDLLAAVKFPNSPVRRTGADLCRLGAALSQRSHTGYFHVSKLEFSICILYHDTHKVILS
jgi:hypothetical protein